jgi:hypothetical protein
MEFELDARLPEPEYLESALSAQQSCIESEVLKGRDTVSRVASETKRLVSGIVEPGQPVRPPPIIFRRSEHRPGPAAYNRRQNLDQLPVNTPGPENVIEQPNQSDLSTSESPILVPLPIEHGIDEDSIWYTLVSEGLL